MSSSFGKVDIMKIGVCKVEGNQFRQESFHAYDQSQERTTLCGLDLRFVTLLGERPDKIELSCSTCKILASKLSAKTAK